MLVETFPKIGIHTYKFTFNNNDIAVILLDEGYEPWFNAEDVCNLLEVTTNHISLNRKRVFKMINGILFLSVLGLRSLIMKSKSETGKLFQSWISNHVLPSCKHSVEKKLENIQREIIKLVNKNRLVLQDKQLVHNGLQVKKYTVKDLLIDNVNNFTDFNLMAMLVVIKINDNLYYVIRCQQENVRSQLLKLENRLNKTQMLKLRIDCLNKAVFLKLYHPNPVCLYKKIKSTLNHKIIVCPKNRNVFSRRYGYSEEHLFRDINKMLL